MGVQKSCNNNNQTTNEKSSLLCPPHVKNDNNNSNFNSSNHDASMDHSHSSSNYETLPTTGKNNKRIKKVVGLDESSILSDESDRTTRSLHNSVDTIRFHFVRASSRLHDLIQYHTGTSKCIVKVLVDYSFVVSITSFLFRSFVCLFCSNKKKTICRLHSECE